MTEFSVSHPEPVLPQVTFPDGRTLTGDEAMLFTLLYDNYGWPSAFLHRSLVTNCFFSGHADPSKGTRDLVVGLKKSLPENLIIAEVEDRAQMSRWKSNLFSFALAVQGESGQQLVEGATFPATSCEIKIERNESQPGLDQKARAALYRIAYYMEPESLAVVGRWDATDIENLLIEVDSAALEGTQTHLNIKGFRFSVEPYSPVRVSWAGQQERRLVDAALILSSQERIKAGHAALAIPQHKDYLSRGEFMRSFGLTAELLRYYEPSYREQNPKAHQPLGLQSLYKGVVQRLRQDLGEVNRSLEVA